MPSQVTKPSDNSWTETELQRFISWVEKGQVGMISVSLTALDTTAVPDIAAGSLFECAGALYEVDSDETPTGWSGIADDTQVYIKFDVSAGKFAFTDTEPSFDEDLGGWYVNNDRYLARVYKDASGDAVGKEVYTIETATTPYKPSTRIPFSSIETLTSGSSWTVPENVYAVKATIVGAGGGGGAATASGGDDGGSTTFNGTTASGGVGGRGGDNNADGRNATAQYCSDNGGSGAIYSDNHTYGENGKGGEIVIEIFSVTPGDSLSYSIGSGGAGHVSSVTQSGGDGADGIIYLEY